jgi:adenylosuccinate lyase
VPLTFGFAIAEYVSRIGKTIERIETRSRALRGKLAGAVGAANATSLIADAEELERQFLSRLGLEPSEHSTQIVEPEPLLELLLELNVCFGILANLADDLRNLQRSEIGEVHELFTKNQVGSSTMPQKRNPWNSEHVKSLWKAFSPRIMTMFMDQISEHQRDLSNSASSRFVTDYICGFAAAVNRMISVLSSLSVDRDRMKANLESAGDSVLAEALYILLSLTGEPEAHEVVRKLSIASSEGQESLLNVLRGQKGLFAKLDGYLRERRETSLDDFLSHPEAYSGIAEAKARQIAEKYRKKMEALSESIGKIRNG